MEGFMNEALRLVKENTELQQRLDECEKVIKVIREALDKIDSSNDDMKYFNSDIHILIQKAREALAKVNSPLTDTE